MQTLADLGPSKLLSSEQERLRDAADTLLFCESVDDDAVLEAMSNARATIEHLHRSGRWTEDRANRLSEDLAVCGPLALVG